MSQSEQPDSSIAEVTSDTLLARTEYLKISLLAILAGGVAAYGALAFRYILDSVQNLTFGFFHEQVYSGVSQLPGWHILLATTLGGLFLGSILYRFLSNSAPQGAVDVLRAVKTSGGKLSLRNGAGSAMVSAASVGIGGSTGVYSPIVHLGACLGSSLARQFGLTRTQTITLLGCGVASAIASTFNAPIAGVIFAHEVMLGHYALASFAPITLASVVGTAIIRFHLTDLFPFPVEDIEINHILEYPLFALMGVLSAGLAIVFMKSVLFSNQQAKKLEWPIWVRTTLGGFVLGVLAMKFPQILGMGNESIQKAIDNEFVLWLFFALIPIKIFATSFSLGMGYGGGIFGPALFLGAMLGAASGNCFDELLPEVVSSVEVYVLVGMGGVVSCVMGSPITTILIVFEMTSSQSLTTAVMISVVIANLISTRLFTRSFFLRQLELMGINPDEGREVQILKSLKVRRLVCPWYNFVSEDDTLEEVENQMRSDTERRGQSKDPPPLKFSPSNDRRKFEGTSEQRKLNNQDAYVLDEEKRIKGKIHMSDLLLAKQGKGTNAFTAQSIAHPPSLILHADMNMLEAMDLLADFVGISIPVVDDPENGKMLGILYAGTVFEAYNRALLQAREEERGHR